MYGHDPAHTSRSPYVGPRTANVRWRYPGLGSASISPAVGADGAVYYASSLLDTLVDPTAATWASIAIDSHGVQRWSTPLTKGAFASGPALGRDGTIYEAFDDGSLAAFDPAGHQKLSVQVSNPGQLHSAPAMGGDGTLYVGSIDKAIHALDAAGHEKWRYAATDWIDESSPAIGRDGTVYFGSIDHVLYAVTPAGALRWSFAADAPLYCSPSVGADGTVYIGSEAGTLYAVGPDGALRWSFAAGAGIRTAPALRDDGVIYVLSSNGHARALTPAGALLWDFDAGVTERPGFHGAAVDATGALYFRVGRELFAVSRDGAKLWQFEGDSDDGGIVVIGGDRVLYTTSGNGLIAIGP
jgi:outer membrane protein assembly factor BamB